MDLAFRGIAVLVQCFQIAEHARELFAAGAEFFGIHGSLPLLGTLLGAEGGWWRLQNINL